MPSKPPTSSRPRSSADPGPRREAGVRCRSLVVIFGDQLDHDAPVLQTLDASRDIVLMMEVAHESRHVPSHTQRTVLFLSAMRHFAEHLRQRGIRVRYTTLDDPASTGTFGGEVARAVEMLRPERIECVRPGEWRVLLEAESWHARFGIPVVIHEDSHFFTTPDRFAAWARGRRSLTMEYFYREQRRATGYLMNGTGKSAAPEGGDWNFDADNRLAFGPRGPSPMPPPIPRFVPDEITRAVIDAVRGLLPDLPGRLESPADFGWPVTRADALVALRGFVRERLPFFGPYEDAMWSTAPTVYHSVLSPLLNLKLLNPRECCEAAIDAYRAGRAPLQSVEAFVRQIIGWREFIRGVYWLEGPSYADRNALDSHGRLPEFYWTGDTDLNCLRHCITQVVNTSFGHHIQRLMVTGNFALISGIHPRAISDWYLGMYADGVDWVTLPNTLGMVMHADAPPSLKPSSPSTSPGRPSTGPTSPATTIPPGVTGVVGTKPYAASGKYIQRMSDYCRGCRYDPAERTGPAACPFTVFYWDFLLRHRERFSKNQRMTMILKNLDRFTPAAVTQIRVDADLLRRRLGITPA